MNHPLLFSRRCHVLRRETSNLYVSFGGSPLDISDPTGRFGGLGDLLVSVGIENVIEGIGSLAGLTLAQNLFRTAFASPISKDKPGEGPDWTWTNAGFSFGFGAAAGTVTSAVAINDTTGDQVAGVNFSVGITPTLGVAKGVPASGGKWFSNQLPLLARMLDEVGDPGVVTYKNVGAVLAELIPALRSFASLAGDQLKFSSGAGWSLNVGGGETFNTKTPGDLAGIGVGGQVSFAGSPGGIAGAFGGYIEGSLGYDLHKNELNGVRYVGAGLNIGINYSSGFAGGAVLGLFIPTNMPDWHFPKNL